MAIKNQTVRNKDFSYRESIGLNGQKYLHIGINSLVNIELECMEASHPKVNFLLKEEIFKELMKTYLSHMVAGEKSPPKQKKLARKTPRKF